MFTHYDLDGVGCYLLAKIAFKERIINVFASGYKKTTKNFHIAVNKYKPENVVFLITDLFLTQEDVNILKPFKAVYLDHHPEVEPIEYPEHWIVNRNLEKCATTLVWERYKDKLPKIEMLEKFVKAVETYDLWKPELKNDKYALSLNALFWKKGFWNFVDYMFENKFKIKAEDYKLFDEKLKFIEKVINEKLYIAEGDVAIFDEREIDYPMEITLFMPENFKHFVFLKPNNKVSFRSKTKNLDEFFKGLDGLKDKRIISVGGHSYAGGFEGINDEICEKAIYAFIQYVSGDSNE